MRQIKIKKKLHQMWESMGSILGKIKRKKQDSQQELPTGVEIVYEPESADEKLKMKRLKKILIICGSIVGGLVLIVAGIFLFLRISGKNNLYSGATNIKPNLERTEEHDSDDMQELDINPDDMGEIIQIGSNVNEDGTGSAAGGENIQSDGSSGDKNKHELSFEGAGSESGYDVIFDGEKYAYNKDMITLLFLGIDKKTTVSPAEDGISGGQSDALFLLIMNPDTMVMDIIAIPRDTIAKISIYNKDGTFNRTGYAQICLQHGYGDGMSLSNERAMEAVSDMLYDLPIHSCTSVNMGAIPELNDAVGGVTLQSLYTFDTGNNKFVQGQTVTLKGDVAYDYVHYRDIYRHYTAPERLARQKQYITLFIKQAINQVKQSIGKVVDVYNVVSSYVVTDLDIDEMTYLASEAISYSFGQIYTLKGEVSTAMKYERYYLDEDALYELIIDKFYEKIN